jgi:hypothetical protein
MLSCGEYSERSLTFKGALEIVVSAEGPPLMLLHGSPTSRRCADSRANTGKPTVGPRSSSPTQ